MPFSMMSDSGNCWRNISPVKNGYKNSIRDLARNVYTIT